MSLRQLLRGVELAIVHAEHFDDPRRAALHRKALDEFDLAVPNAKDVRDIIEHFDEYQLGRGRLQRSGTAPPEPLALYPEGHGEQYRIHLLDGYELAIEPTLAAAQKLADRTMAVLSDS